jgi:hypothetical protein
MNTSYTFKVENLERESDGFVHTAFYTYTGVSTTGTSVKTHSLAGICTFSRPDSLVPYTDLTESQLIGWIQTGIGSSAIESLQEDLNRYIDPNIGGTPW